MHQRRSAPRTSRPPSSSSVWNETYSTGGTPSETWNSVFGCTTGGSSNPIYAYWALNNTGTESTWASTTGASFPGAASHWPSKQIIFENETASILKNAATVPDRRRAVLLLVRELQQELHARTPSELSTDIVSAPVRRRPTTANSVQLGTTLNGIALNADRASTPSCLAWRAAAFPGDRLLYNVYADGDEPEHPGQRRRPPLNAVSEDGFLCKPATATDIDPNTGVTYRSEIDAVITGQGFFPLPNLQVEDGQGDTAIAAYNSTEAGIPNPAWNDGLSASKYNAANETGSPWNFAAANVDTDNSAVSGTYTNVEDGSSTLGTLRRPVATPAGRLLHHRDVGLQQRRSVTQYPSDAHRRPASPSGLQVPTPDLQAGAGPPGRPR